MFRVIISTLLSGILCLCSVVGKCESIDLDKNTLLKENIAKVEINVVIIPIRDSQYCYMFETNKREQIEYLMHMLETMDFIDDGKTRYGADVPMVYIYLTDKNDTTYKCGFYNGRFCDDSEKQYAVNSDDYRRFLSFVYALKTGKIVLDKDVTFTPSDWAYKDIESAKDMGIVPKRNQINYTGKINRLEVCEISAAVLKKAGFALSSGYKNPFSDTGNSDVCLLNELNIVNGKSDTEFCPYDNITREETAKIL